VTESVAFITPSYRVDRERCALLSRSLEACAPSVEHWIVVDRGDLDFFRPLQSNRTHVVAKEEVLPVWVRRLDTLRIGLHSNVWIQARGTPIRAADGRRPGALRLGRRAAAPLLGLLGGRLK
jgi:hypothetical protein